MVSPEKYTEALEELRDENRVELDNLRTEIARLTLAAETFERQYRQACQDHATIKAERDALRAALIKAVKFIDHELPSRGRTMVFDINVVLEQLTQPKESDNA